MRANAVVLSRVFYDGVQRRQRAPVAGLSEPANRRAASAETAVPRDVNECWDAGALDLRHQGKEVGCRLTRRHETKVGDAIVDALPRTADRSLQSHHLSA